MTVSNTLIERVESASGLPQTAPGHWDTVEGRSIAEDYLKLDRASLFMGDKSDLALANAQYLEDISVGTVTFQSAIGMQTAAKERIRWLSAQLAASNLCIVELEAEARRFASFYEAGSDGRNTFVIFADKIAAALKARGLDQ